ncbi:hypothetical protein H1P_1940002 [Hyella patelloides LEGE 07179]|uniref:Uncharacterized protein n=1 Tax=Hyella patelloides LEGE 07179 TaxID=945734 RepID=A0A563VPD3_9CYAN|nr:hypothetical protein H1P_1940002 [Hyella patelloides LEGE 07179]
MFRIWHIFIFTDHSNSSLKSRSRLAVSYRGSSTAGYLGYSNYTPNLFNLSELELFNSSFPALNAPDGYK